MARGGAASASARSDSIKGLAQFIANPTYRRLLTAEPTLRRAVPILIVAFLLTVGVGAVVQILEHQRKVLADARAELEWLAEAIGDRLQRGGARSDLPKAAQALLEQSIPRTAPAGRQIFVTNQDGVIIASWPRYDALRGATLAEVLGPQPAPTGPVSTSGPAEITLPSAGLTYESLHELVRPLGQIAVVQSRHNMLAAWRADTALTVTLFATTGFVLLILGFAFHWQATRAREADQIYDTVRSRIDAALNSGRCGLWDWDIARGKVFWSHSMFELLGLPAKDELLSLDDIDALVHPDDVRLADVAKRFATSERGVIDHTFRMRHARGHWTWLRARCEVVLQSGEPAGHIVGIVVDTTEQRDMADRSAAADIRLRDAIDAISEAFVIWDAENRLVVCNSKFRRLYDVPDELSVAGASYRDIMNAGAQPVVHTKVTESCRADHGLTFEAELDDGRWLQISERRTKDGGFVSVGTDITLLKRQEERLLESEKQLVAMVVDLQASQQALEIQAEQMALLAEKYSEEKTRAEEANHAKSEFLANMSHELRTPLNAIIGFSEIMVSGVLGELNAKHREYCSDIRESGRYLLEVINDILDMAKIEAGRLELEIERFALDAVVGEALRIIAPRAQDKKLTLAIDVDAELVLLADRRGLKQILLNLLSNAVKFTPEGGRIEVQARRGGGAVAIAIEDTGIGIPESAMPNLGRPFEQVQSQLTKNHQGSGLGLAIAKSLTEMHGGRLAIRSAPGVGTTVLVELPVTPQAPAAAEISPTLH